MRAATGRHPITPTGGINDGFKRGDALATSYWYSFVLILNSNPHRVIFSFMPTRIVALRSTVQDCCLKAKSKST